MSENGGGGGGERPDLQARAECGDKGVGREAEESTRGVAGICARSMGRQRVAREARMLQP